MTEAKGNVEEAINSSIKWHTIKAASGGAIAGLGGFGTALILVPADISSIIINQLRMIQTIALLRGYDTSDDNVKKLSFLCLAGSKMSEKKFCNPTRCSYYNESSSIFCHRNNYRSCSKMVGFKFYFKIHKNFN